MFFVSLFSTSSAKFSESDSGNVILFQIKVFGRNIKETTLARYFVKVTARPSFTQLRVIRPKNKIHWISKQKIYYKDSVVSPSYLNLLGFIFMLYEILFLLHISYLCYIFYYIFIYYIFICILYVFNCCYIFLFSHYLILYLCDSVSIFIIYTTML